MFRFNFLLVLIMFFLLSNCGIKIPTFTSIFNGKNKAEDTNHAKVDETSDFDNDLFFESDTGTVEDSTSTDWFEGDLYDPWSSNDTTLSSQALFAFSDGDDFPNESNFSINDKVDTYSDVVASFQDQITKLKSELETTTDELYKLKAKSQIWENPFSIYNKEIILTNGSTVYGKIIYQDQDILYVETLIGGLTIQRDNIKRVVENITQIADSTDYDDYSRRKDIIEIKKSEHGAMFKSSKKLLANSILLGDIIEEVDFRGNRILSGDIKNIGEARSDFVKINFVFRMNWQGKTKALTAFVRGSKYVFPDSNIESDSSIEPGAVAGFELVIPSNFGTFIGYSYSIDWEQYDD